MSRKKKKPAQSPAVPRWQFPPDIPTDDLVGELRQGNTWQLGEAIENFIYCLEGDRFLTWEAVVCEEQGLPLTAAQKRALGQLLSFNDEPDDQILYIDEIPRPSQPWHVILNQIVPHLLVEPWDTAAIHDETYHEGWPRLAEALLKHGGGLSLPPRASSVLEVVPADLRHRLWLQFCFDMLSGLGQEEELTLTNEDQVVRVDWFIKRLQEHRDSVAYFQLTLDSLLSRVVLPERDRVILVRLMSEKLGLLSGAAPLADHLPGSAAR
jgi:hypothetical protein